MFLHAVHPLFWIGLFIIGAGVHTLIRQPAKARIPGIFFVIAGVFLVILTGKDLVFGPSHAVASIRNADAAKVVAFEIGPIMGTPSSSDLTPKTIRITDRKQIEQLVALLSASTYASPNHPEGRWMTLLTLDDGKDRNSAAISFTSDGLLIRINGGGVGREFRNEALKGFLEEVAKGKP